uniref:Putative secreted protein n=1 Tax=Anopheles triannulatus TaxID=58253 RepID=A0A2M4B7L9_9DIPT
MNFATERFVLPGGFLLLPALCSGAWSGHLDGIYEPSSKSAKFDPPLYTGGDLSTVFRATATACCSTLPPCSLRSLACPGPC